MVGPACRDAPGPPFPLRQDLPPAVSASGSGVLDALERHCRRCPRLNLFHFLTMLTLSLRENRSSVQALSCIGQE